jgi:ubiquinone/menaquinone biosynthesis C-methylase UbiE
MKKTEDEARRIFGARAAFYVTSAAHADPQVLARVVALAAPEPDWIALDVATGTGHTAFAVGEKVRKVIATDLTPEMLRQADTLRASRGITNVSFEVADVHALPFAAGSFHLITCRRAAHHFSAIGHALDEMRRVLAPGGRVVIDDRSIPEDDEVDRVMNRLDAFHDPSHVREYRPSEWRALFGSHGFAVEALDCYAKHRPLTAFTEKAAPEGVRGIQELVANFTPAQRAALDFREVDGEPYCTHWYVTIAGRTA